MKTPEERRQDARRQKLEEIREQLDSGSLVIRPMTREERRRYPPRPQSPRRKRR